MSPIESRRYNKCSGCCFINNLRSLRTAKDLVVFELGARRALLEKLFGGFDFSTPCLHMCFITLSSLGKDECHKEV